MSVPVSITIKNYRSIEEATIPLESKVCALVGPNNSGKSNVLKAISIIANETYNRLDTNTTEYIVEVGDNTINKIARTKKNFRNIIFTEDIKTLKVTLKASNSHSLNNTSATLSEELPARLKNYFASDDFLHDFGHRADLESNKKRFVLDLGVQSLFKGSVYLPNIRFITKEGSVPPFHNQWEFPGETIAFDKLIPTLASIDRPSRELSENREVKKGICDFIGYCLEAKNVDFEVSNDRNVIHLTIDGEERRLDDFGTGVEQLLLIGTAIQKMPDRFVLIDEPEVHLHPGTQKRIIRYFTENTTDNTRIIIATHSPSIIDNDNISLIRTSRSEGVSKYTTIKSNNERYEAVRALGHRPSELVQTNFVIWVEGPSDRIYVNSWINWSSPNLIEGIDYSVLIYGGRLLSNHSYDEQYADLIQCLPLSRRFCVLMDSDKRSKAARINTTKKRVEAECKNSNAMCWITRGREIENYIPPEVFQNCIINGISEASSPYDSVFTVDRPDKVKIAKIATAEKWKNFPLDLKAQVKRLINEIERP